MTPHTHPARTDSSLWIDIHRDTEVCRWADSFGVTPEELRLAVFEAGDRADLVQEHLTGIPALHSVWH